MEEQVAPYIADRQIPSAPPPRSEVGWAATMRKNLFSTPVDSALTLIGLAILVYAAWGVVNWALINAHFLGGDREDCLPAEGEALGACWAFVINKFRLFMYGTYPTAELWRPNVTFLVFAGLMAAVMIPRIPYKAVSVTLLTAVFPVFALVLLTGGNFGLSGGFVAFLFMMAAIATLVINSEDAGGLAGWPVRAAFIGILVALVALVLSSFSRNAFEILDLGFTPFSAIAFVAALFSIGVVIHGMRQVGRGSVRQALIPLGAMILLSIALAADFGLRPVPTNLWGGLMVTLVVAVTGIAASLPLGILLALGRQSNLPAIKWLCIAFIEFWRGVPLITVLFMASFMLPLFMPQGVTFNQLLRALIGVALFSSAYQAEVVRGGLQAIPSGQYEGAQSLGLSYWQTMRMIILPQALKMVIPGIVNTFIGLFKDTSLVYIIGLADLLGQVRRGFSDPNWITASTPATGLVFAGFVFWAFCFGMSRYSMFIERRLDTSYSR